MGVHERGTLVVAIVCVFGTGRKQIFAEVLENLVEKLTGSFYVSLGLADSQGLFGLPQDHAPGPKEIRLNLSLSSGL